MTTIHERIETRLELEQAFAHVADFANASTWDPGTVTSERVDAGPLGVGARYRLGVRLGSRVAPMTYRIDAFEPPHRVVLNGSGSGVSAVDDIRFEGTATGTRIDYRADIRLGGPLGLLQPFLGGRFEKIGRDAAAGMRRTLDGLAARSTAPTAGGGTDVR